MLKLCVYIQSQRVVLSFPFLVPSRAVLLLKKNLHNNKTVSFEIACKTPKRNEGLVQLSEMENVAATIITMSFFFSLLFFGLWNENNEQTCRIEIFYTLYWAGEHHVCTVTIITRFYVCEHENRFVLHHSMKILL
jgi:hypothetical protein